MSSRAVAGELQLVGVLWAAVMVTSAPQTMQRNRGVDLDHRSRVGLLVGRDLELAE